MIVTLVTIGLSYWATKSISLSLLFGAAVYLASTFGLFVLIFS